MSDTTQTYTSTYSPDDPYGSTTADDGGRVFTVGGGDWDDIVNAVDPLESERIVINMGPQHPSTHGVLRMVLELEGESVARSRVVIGYLHTGIEKNMEFRNWVQAVTFITRCDYLAPLFNEMTYCLGVERLLDVEDQIPERVRVIRVLVCELQRISSHLVWLATGGMEIGAITMMLFGLRERERILMILEMITGLRMNHAYIRPGGVAQDLPPGAVDQIREFIPYMRDKVDEYETLLTANPIWLARLRGTGYLDTEACLQLGVTGPLLRASGLAWDLRKEMPYSDYSNYDFDVVTETAGDNFARYLVRINEIRQSLRIIEQALDRLRPGPVMIEDRKIAWPAQLALGSDGLGNSLDHIRHIMGESMEALIHHFKLVTEGFRVPPGQAYVPVESPRGELGAHVVSDGGTRPFRAHFRDPSFTNLQATSVMSEGGMVADVIVAIASIDPVMGGVDR
ncbi:MAG: NADH-quinone oxidoreductase subunit [Actinomycetota bacterium]|nr:NADH-quinone oxidoreductase subunit [Actinomycetota bacterium]